MANTNVNFLLCNYRQLNNLELKFNKIIINGTVNADPLNLIDKLNVDGKLICILKEESSSNIYLFNKKINNFILREGNFSVGT